MPITDVLYVVQWWLILFIAGVSFLPLSARIFSHFKDKGYAFSKILSIVCISYSVYLLGLLRVLEFSKHGIYVLFSVFALLIIWLNKAKLRELFSAKKLILFIFEELIFFLALFGWTYIRGHNPEIYGLEKYMDFGFVNSILRSKYFPPVDMWYSPMPINYYYFGHFITATLTKASNIPSYVTYNLMIATLFALTFIESFSLGLSIVLNKSKFIVRGIFAGLLIASLITLSGNLHVVYTFFKPYETDKPVPYWELEFAFYNPCFQKDNYVKINKKGEKEIIECTTDEQAKKYLYPNNYWYPNATRFIHNTIHEFPIYSWVVADLHGHVLDIPIVLLAISILFSLLIETTPSGQNSKKTIFKLILISFIIATMYMTNAWDGLTYMLLTACVLLFLEWKRISQQTHSENNNLLFSIIPVNNISKNLKSLFYKKREIDLFSGIAIRLFILLVSFIIFALPFSLNFDSSKIVGGIGIVGAPSILLEKNFLGGDGTDFGEDKRNILKKIFIPDHCKSLMLSDDLAKITTSYNSRKIGPFLFEPDHCLRSPGWQLFILYGFFYFFVVVFFISRMKKNKINSSDEFISILILVSSILIILPEFFYMKDIYPDHYRANTMFKLVFQAFIMLSIVSGYTIIKTISKKYFSEISKIYKPIYLIYAFIAIILVSIVFLYPYFAITSYYNRLSNYVGLDGLKYLKDRTPSDYETIMWFNNNIKNQPVILEAQGDSYTDYERISANTGLPTVLGWYVHEWLWRGIDAPKVRAEEVKQIYESTNIQEVYALLNKYKINYIVIGALEREKYPSLNENVMQRLGKKVFQSGDNIVYKINILID